MLGCSFSALMGWHGWWGMVAVVLVIAMVIYFLVWYGDTKKRKADSEASLGILKKRLAAGEITADEFNTLKQYL